MTRRAILWTGLGWAVWSASVVAAAAQLSQRPFAVAGGEGGAAHTLHEWYSPKDREIALKRVLLLTLAMLEWAAEQ